MKKFYKLFSILCIVAMMMALAAPVFASDTNEPPKADICQDEGGIVPYAEPHCQQGNKIGVIIETHSTKKIGSETGRCTHGVINGTDIRYQYQDFTEYSCTLCSYRATVGGTPYWGSWSCLR